MLARSFFQLLSVGHLFSIAALGRMLTVSIVVAATGLSTDRAQAATVPTDGSLCTLVFAPVKTIQSCLCDTVSEELTVVFTDGTFDTQPSISACAASTLNTGLPSAQRFSDSLSRGQRVILNHALFLTRNNNLPNERPGTELSPQEQAILDFVDEHFPLLTRYSLNEFNDRSPRDPLSYRAQPAFSPAVFNAMETAIGMGEAEDTTGNGTIGLGFAPTAQRLAAQSPGFVRPTSWRVFGGGQVSSTRDSSASLTDETNAGSANIGLSRRISERVSFSFQAYGGYASTQTNGAADNSDVTSLGVLATAPVQLDHGMTVTPILGYQRDLISQDETVGAALETSSYHADYLTIGGQVQRRWYRPDEQHSVLYYIEPQAQLLHTWQRVSDYTRSDGTQFSGQTSSSGQAQLSLEAGAMLEVDWGLFGLAMPSAQLDAGYTYGSEGSDGWQAGLTGRLRLVTRNLIRADLSLGYHASQDRRTITAGANLVFPLRP